MMANVSQLPFRSLMDHAQFSVLRSYTRTLQAAALVVVSVVRSPPSTSVDQFARSKLVLFLEQSSAPCPNHHRAKPGRSPAWR
jgi:hypothetical protein